MNIFDEFNDVGEQYVIIAFKRIDPDGNEHWLNKAAVKLTKRNDDVFPSGHLSHVELMFENNKRWYRCSINKKTGTYDKNGKITWRPGAVHCKYVSQESMKDYDYFLYYANRQKQKEMYNFCISQLDNKFNFWGYVLNFFIPFGRIGTHSFYPRLLRRKTKWFCSELIVVALQSCDAEEFRGYEARAVSPNDLYRICEAMNFPFISSPVCQIQI